ncbi:MAG TPA: class I SAM-dependent methyltransferase [Longimicrobium sp.]|jgi:predicted O-methyltransferase YrrM
MVKPLLRRAYRALTTPLDRLATRELARAAHPDAPRLARVIEELARPLPAGDRAAIDAIERARAGLLARTDPLDDGTLGGALVHDRGLTVGEACVASKGPVPARALYALVREFQPASILELGTNVGISTAYLAAALRSLGGGGRTTTLEASPYRLRVARETHHRLGLDGISYRQGLFADTLEPALQEIGDVDFVFIDGYHQYEPTLSCFGTIWKRSRPGALFVFDDIRWSKGMRRAWKRLQHDERLSLTADLGCMGVAVGRSPRDASVYRSRRMYSVLR